jgi:hypothetical protein
MMALSNGAGLSGTVPCNYKGTTKRAENQIFRHLKNEGFKTLSPPSSVGSYLLNSPRFTKNYVTTFRDSCRDSRIQKELLFEFSSLLQELCHFVP